MNAEIISIGTELLLGEIVDTNSAHIARNLRDIGLNLFFTTTVGDNQARIVEALNAALDRADIVITTGGLGPTVDDVTRQSVAAATDRGLEFHQELLDEITERFAQLGSQMSPNNRLQAFIPADAIPISNPVGTAPCFIVESNRGIVISLPGVPSEMKYLLDHAVIPYLREHFGLTSIIKARVLRTAGIGESTIDDLIGDLMTLPNPTVGLAAHTGQTDIRITAKATDETTANTMIEEVERQVRQRVGDYIYGTGKEKLETVVVRELQRLGLRMAVSETGPGAQLQERLQSIPGSLEVLAGADNYESIDTLLQVLALPDATPVEELSLAACKHVRQTSGADLGIAIIVRSDVTLIAVITPTLTKTRVYRFSEQENRPSVMASTWGMALVWRWLSQQQS
ncbi:MAG: CinA family nicotinamide mononucleotide deamidase-related protein [Anaerolineae bacterium]|nr:CinA family nicotinamide mononucleotide deamidase-related protein [Anaerolineae bacterium]